MSVDPGASAATERRLVAYLAGVQFVNVLSLMIVMPLGPDFARALGIPLARLGAIAAGYTLAAALAGTVGAWLLDRFDRRSALGVCLVGLALAVTASAAAVDLATLLAARVASGLFGGPAASLTLAILADNVPVARRGRALGLVMTAFSVASVVGVPLGLRLSHAYGWQAPFLVTGSLAAIFALAAFRVLPPQRAHLSAAQPAPLLTLLGRRETLLAYASTAVAMVSAFLIIPHLSGFAQLNLGYPRARLEWLYGAGGLATFMLVRLIGRWVDRVGSFRVSLLGSALLSAILWLGFAQSSPVLPVMVIFVGFMLAGAVRNIANQALSTRVPSMMERARFMSMQSTVQHLASSAGAAISTLVLAVDAEGRLLHMDRLARCALVLCWLLPALQFALERRVRAREAQPEAPLDCARSEITRPSRMTT